MFLVAFQSCSKNDDLMFINESISLNAEYLDTDVTDVSNISTLTELQKEILKKARTRIDAYVVYKNKVYSLKVSSGSKIQMSERLFEFFKARMNKTNTIIKDLNGISQIKNSKELHIITQPELNGIVRLKSANTESDIPPLGENGFNLSWDGGIQIYISADTIKGLSNYLYVSGGVLTIGSYICGATGIAAPIGAALGIVGVLDGLMGLAVDNYGNNHPTGIIITIYSSGVSISDR